MLNALPIKKHREKKYNEYMLLGNKAMRNGDGRLARKYIKKACGIMKSKKAMAYYLLSFCSYKLVLKLRSKI